MNKLAKYVLTIGGCAALVASASAQVVGHVSTVSGEIGSVLVMHSGDTYSPFSGKSLFEGDRITTKAGGSVSIDAYGCSHSLGELSAIVVNANFCHTTPVELSLASAGAPSVATSAAAVAAVPASTFTAAGALIPVAAISAVQLGTMAVLSEETADDEPTSP